MNPAPESRSPGRWPGPGSLLLVALALWLFKDALFLGGVFYKRDIHLVWHPQVEGFVRAIASGSWPTWDSSPAFGQPLLADPSAMILYPLTWLNLLMRPWVYYTLFAVLHFLFSALGMRALGRALGLGPQASFASATLWALSGPYLSLVDLWHHFAGASWMPWVVLTALRALSGGRREAAIFGVALGAQVLAGSADMCAMTLFVAAALGAAQALDLRQPFSAGNRAAMARGLGGVLLALGLSAASWVTALEVASRAARANLPQSVRTYWSLHPAVLLEAMLPRLFDSLPLLPDVRAALFEGREPFFAFLYLGVATLPLLGAALAIPHPLRRVLMGMVIVAALLALGTHTPVHGLVTTLLPPLRILRYPVKVMVVVAFAWALLAGLGVTAWLEERRGRRFTLGATLPLALVGVLALLLGLATRWAPGEVARPLFEPKPGRPPELALTATSERLFTTAGFAASALLLAVGGGSRRLPGTRAGAALLGLAILDLAYHHRSPNPVAPRGLYTYRPAVLGALGDLATARVYVYDYSVPGKIEQTFGPGRHPYTLARVPEGWAPGPALALGIQAYLAAEIPGRFALSQAFGTDLRGLQPSPLTRLTMALREVEGTPYHLRLLRAGGVTHTVALHPLEDLGPGREVEGFFERPIVVQGVETPLPRVFAVGEARPADDDDALRLLLDPTFDLRRSVVLAWGPESRGEGQEERNGSEALHVPIVEGGARIVAETPGHLVVEADLQSPGYVVVLDTFDPGWRALVNGREAPLLRANLAFRAVALPSGRHRIEMDYRPRSLRLGLMISVLTGTGLLAGLAFSGRSRRSA